MTELSKKNDDYKRAYNEMKTNFGKAQKDLEEVKGPQKNDVNEQEVKEKYESLKVKHKVSRENSILAISGKSFPIEPTISIGDKFHAILNSCLHSLNLLIGYSLFRLLTHFLSNHGFSLFYRNSMTRGSNSKPRLEILRLKSIKSQKI